MLGKGLREGAVVVREGIEGARNGCYGRYGRREQWLLWKGWREGAKVVMEGME